ncbi:MAG: type I-C CRISPR-associated protein Cas7/Csd2 [Elusimicrobia bacterium CG_4_9_14_3_um_filter_62_55]|nr:MAG: type I-C CRISPR-associated protein Cas7/Csd2 [Elusimicrobia bacterium CG_4_9_14_3_um_filter_62_55]
MTPISNRYDFVYLFDVADGNPNGDPDAGNLPRVDPETGQGLVTDVCLKRKLRNYVLAAKDNKPPFEMFVLEKAVLNKQIDRGAVETNAKPKKGEKQNPEKAKDAQAWLCKNFFDIRAFGAVLSTGDFNAGQVLGPIQMTFARSVDRIVPAEHSITRMAVTTEKEAVAQEGDNRTMGRKATIPYGLYKSHGFVNVPPAKKTGFSEDDLELVWKALNMMFDLDRSAARGLMAKRGLFVFKHESALGNAPAAALFDRVQVKRKADGPARNFSDYEVSVDEKDLPAGVTLVRM